MSEGTFFIPFMAQLPLIFSITPVSLLLSIMVFIAAFFILVYATGYMQKEKGKMRFFVFMLLFITGMQLFIFAGDWLLLLTAWEIISVASYFLISFYQTDKAIKAGNRAFLTTRSADTGLLIGILLLFSLTQTTEIAKTVTATGSLAQLAAVFILIAGFAKAAQVPFDGWLRDAMAGPTPVSALLHSATLVAAGVILIIKIFPLFTSPLLLLIGIIGGITALITGVAAITQYDLKRMLAASTSAQLGLMFVAIGAGSPGAALLHLIANASMKGSLFLSAGVFQHIREGTEFQKLKGIGRKNVFVFSVFVITGLALSGIPPLAGFFTKDAIISATIESPLRVVLMPIALLASVFTGIYIARTIKLLWSGQGEDQPLAGKMFMYFGIAGLVFFVLTFFLFFPLLEEVVGFEAIEGNLPLLLGLTFGVIGLTVGWIWKDSLIPKNLTAILQNGFYISSKLDSLFINATQLITNKLVSVEEFLVSLPQKTAIYALQISQRLSQIDLLLTQQIFGIGRTNLSLSNFLNQSVDFLLTEQTFGIGKANLYISNITNNSGETFINGIINYVVTEVRQLGTFARRLQTGLIHQEMAYALYGAIFMIVIYIVITIMIR